MTRDPRALLTGFGKLIGVIVAGVAIGAALGLAVSALAGNGGDEPAASKPVASPTSTPTPTVTAAATVADAKAKVLSVAFAKAKSASGKMRKRARLTVRTRVTNGGSGPLTIGRPALMLAAGRTDADPNADSFAGALLKPIGAGKTAMGVLRFETAGAVTTQLAARKPATLLVAGQRLPIKLVP